MKDKYLKIYKDTGIEVKTKRTYEFHDEVFDNIENASRASARSYLEKLIIGSLGINLDKHLKEITVKVSDLITMYPASIVMSLAPLLTEEMFQSIKENTEIFWDLKNEDVNNSKEDD